MTFIIELFHAIELYTLKFDPGLLCIYPYKASKHNELGNAHLKLY